MKDELKLTLAFGSEFHSEPAPVGGVDFAYHQAFFFQAIGDTGDVAPSFYPAMSRVGPIVAACAAGVKVAA